MKSGLYQILNLINGKRYVGSSVNITKRFKAHLRDLRRNKHHSRYLQRAWNKYGEESFKFEIIFECNEKDLLDVEQNLIVWFEPEYNVSLSAFAPMTGRKHSKETREKMKERPRLKGKDSHLFGTKWSPELREKIIKARTGKKRSVETRKKMSETAKRLNRANDLRKYDNSRKIIDSNGNVFKSMTEAAKFWGISLPTVCDILKGRHSKTRKGISFKYA